MTAGERPMRLAVFTSQFPSRVSTFFARDMRGLLDAGVELDVFPLYPLDPALWAYVPPVLDESVLPRERVHHVSLPPVAGEPGSRRPPSAARFARAAASASLSALAKGPLPAAKTAYALAKAWAWAAQHGGRFDHVLAYWGNYAATSALAFRRASDPAVPVSMFLHAGTDLYRPVGLRAKLRDVDNVLAVCRFNARYLEERYPDLRDALHAKTHVHHIGLDLDELPFSPEGRAPARLLAVGSFEKAKGFEDLVTAAAHLRARGRAVDVELVGDGPRRGAIAALAARHGIAEHVHDRGWLPFDEVRTAMRGATLLVHPSIGLGDAVPTVIKEALALGTPVVASDVAGIPELLDEGRCGVLVPPRDPVRLAGAVAGLLGDEPRRRALARAGRSFAEATFDLRRNGRRLAEILRATPARTLRTDGTVVRASARGAGVR